LVRLPKLSIYYEPPEISAASVQRSMLGVRDDSVLFWCCQHTAKFLPEQDAVFARIASRVPGAQFVFIGEGGAERHLERIERAFVAHGVSFEGRCVLVPPLSAAEFDGAVPLMRCHLDCIGWAGCNSTLETLRHNVPVVTVGGRTMRSRHSIAILRQMGVTETIAGDADEFVDIAVRIATDDAWWRQLSAKIASTKELVYRDLECIRALEHFFVRALDKASGS